MTNPRMTSTYSMWSLFRNCRMACKLRYLDFLVALESDPNLRFGSAVHQFLECWHKHRDLTQVFDLIDRSYPNRAADDDQLRDWHLATAIMKGYAALYPVEEFSVVELEKKFEGEIVNPATGATSRSFTLAGKVDGIVRIGDEHFLLEHKTASILDSGYIERLWTDFQIILYCWYVEQVLGIRINGVIYNVIVKAKLQQSKGESETEYEARRAELIAKSKTGKTTAKRRMPETNDEFQARLATKYTEPGMFHREILYISRDRFAVLQSELWELTQNFLDARRRDTWYQNTSQCFQYGRPCAYFPLCRSDFSPLVRDNHYRVEPPHTELSDNVTTTDNATVF
ncbi:MAG: PD-(D/E)XK nuclease family protein [Deltaproteobacteria bacterium]|nr:PD-(D/E)XK nuclease family protein [Deltaproteobacteria bacterium]